MRKLFLFLIALSLLIPKQTKAQDDGAVAAAVVGGVLAIGAGIAAVKQMEEQAELKATEWLLSNNPDLTSFYVKTLDFEGKKLKDMSAVSVITFKVRKFEMADKESKDDYVYGDKWVLFGFTSRGWINEYGIDFNKVRWYLIDPTEWMNMMIEYVKAASDEEDISYIEETLEKGNVVNKGIKIKSKLTIPFHKLKGDMYLVTDYSDDMKLIYNERSLGIYLKETRDLVQIRRSTLIEVHDYLFYKE
jgi:hypothetical protein